MTLFKICTFILFYFIARLAFTPTSNTEKHTYGSETRQITTAQVAFLTE